MKNGDVYSDPNMRWFERQWPLLGKTYFTHAWGTLYVLSGSVAAHLSSVPDGLLRFFGNEGEPGNPLQSSPSLMQIPRIFLLLFFGTPASVVSSNDVIPFECFGSQM